MNYSLQTFFFSATSTLTKYFPRAGSRFLDFIVRPLIGNRPLAYLLSKVNLVKLKKVRGHHRILVNPDIHIGDAIMAQSIVSAVRDFFPEAEVDFVLNKSVMPLIEGNPEINRLIPVYTGGSMPPDSEIDIVSRLLVEGGYDFCINCNPFLSGKRIQRNSRPVFDVMTHAANLVINENTTKEINHFAFQHQRFVHGILTRLKKPKKPQSFSGVGVWLDDKTLEEAASFMDSLNLDKKKPVAILQTDTASNYTRIPFHYQVELAESLLKQNVSVLVGAGHNDPGIGQRLIDSVPESLRANLKIIPSSMKLATYSALSDHADLFITGDTGPMHITAARKYSRTGKHKMRNRTALLCVFGATPARMSGYDSFQKGYLPANQDAPSWTVVAGSPCRNITCLNKMFKTCETIRCFEELDITKVVDLFGDHLATASRD